MSKRIAIAGLALGALLLISLLAAFFGDEDSAQESSQGPGVRLEGAPAKSAHARASTPARPSQSARPAATPTGTPQATPQASTSPVPSSARPKRGERRRRGKRKPAPKIVLTGLVVDPQGRPVADARVNAQSRRSRRRGPSATTDALGRFRIELSSREAWIGARPPKGAPDLAPAKGVEWREKGEALEFELPDPIQLTVGAALVGRVVDLEGEGVSGASIRTWGRNRDSSQGKADAEGRFRLEGLAAGTYTVEAKAKGFVSDSIQVPVTVNRGGVASFSLSRSGSLRGVVRGVDGLPLRRAAVFAFRAGESLRQAMSDKEGQYTLADLSPGPLEVFVRSRDRSLTVRVSTRIDVGLERPLDLTLNEGGKIRGTLTDAARNPLAKWRIRVRSTTGRVRRDAESDENGNYEVKGLYPGVYRIAARPPNSRGDLIEEELEVGLGITRRDLTATLGAQISGQVLDGEGNPVRAEVHAIQGEDTEGYTRCDEKGNFQLKDLPPGSYVLYLRRRSRSEGELVGRHEIEVQPGARREGLALTVYAPAKIRGRITGIDAAKLVGLRVSARSTSGSVNRRSRTDKEGSFALAPFYDGEYELTLGATQLSLLARELGVSGLSVDPVRVQIEGGRDVEVVLRVQTTP
ncbi:MAG: carboxypeptidase regulatory-like domain-containing protein [Planctomycetes bacterium]|nr:carboxypeptidase regulatory-like domain-containing protein [Planctomycetota bacterium]